MDFSLDPAHAYLRAELVERESGEAAMAFLDALADQCAKHGVYSVLICVRASRPIFGVDAYRASLALQELACRPEYRVALVSSRPDIRAAHEYLEVLAGEHGAHMRSFSGEAAAAEWLRSAPPVPMEAGLLAKSP